jgi:peptide/nickel transport system permease protein
MRLVWRKSGDLRVPQKLFRGVLTVVLAFLFSASLLRFSPGWNVDESDIDPRYSTSTVRDLRLERAEKRGLFQFYVGYLSGVLSGDFGISHQFGRPVRDLIRERTGTTTRSVAIGLFTGWVLALVIAAATSRDTTRVGTVAATSFSGALLSCPSALLAVLCLALDLPAAAAIAAVVFPRAFPHAHEQFQHQLLATHVIMARGRGISGLQLFRSHIAPGALPALAALAGASVPLALGAAIPIESLGDSPGLGQLAWRAALGRDMPLLVSLTLLLTIVSVTANLAADLAVPGARGRRR